MKTLINRYYYSLADLTGHDSPVASPLTTFDYMLREIAPLWAGGVTLAAEQKMFQDYLWPEFYDAPVFYYDVECNPWLHEDGDEPDLDDVIEAAYPLLGRFHRWYQESKERYIYLITQLESIKSNLLDRVGSESITLFNDTPQSGGNFVSDPYTTNATKSTVESDVTTPIARLKEVQDLLRNYYADWADEFNEFVLHSAE